MKMHVSAGKDWQDNKPAPSTALSEISQKACIIGLQNTLWWSNKPSIFAPVQLHNWNAIDNPVSPSSLSNFNNWIPYFSEKTQLSPLQTPVFLLPFRVHRRRYKGEWLLSLEPQRSPPAARLQPSHRTINQPWWNEHLGHNFQDSDMPDHRRSSLCQYLYWCVHLKPGLSF